MTYEIKGERVLVTKKVIVKNEAGLHARPAALFVQRANEFKSDIFIELEGKKADAKSIIGIMSLGVYSGETIVIGADGRDEEEAIESLKKLLEEELVGM